MPRKTPDRFIEHPANVIVLTNLYYSEAPWLKPGKSKTEDLFWKSFNWKVIHHLNLENSLECWTNF